MGDQIAALIVGLSGSASDVQQLHTQLKQAIPSITGRAHQALQLQILQQLDHATHSLGCLFLLEAHTRSGLPPGGDPAFVDVASAFLRRCTPAQIRLAPELLVQLCKRFKEQVMALGRPRVGIAPLLAALQKLQPSREHLTPIHADFFQLCLLAKVYNAAEEVLSDDIFEVDPSKTCVTPTDLFLYCYYGGMLAIGRKQYTRALELLLQALTAPAVVGNAIVVAAYKKLVLVSLIHTGGLTHMPKYTPSRVKSIVESESKAYQELSSAYGTHNAERLRKVVEQYSATYNADTNMGLVKQVVASLVKRNIQRLTQTYMTLSLGDIATNVGLASAQEAELYVLRMIESGDVHAQIDERDGMVRFLEDPEQFNNAAMAARVDAQIRRCIQVAAKMQSVHDMVVCDKQYLSKVTAKERSRFDAQEEFGASQGLYQP